MDAMTKERKERLDQLKRASISTLIGKLCFRKEWDEDVLVELAHRRVDVRPDINEYCDKLHRRVEKFRDTALEAFEISGQ
jgi:hypothetical protein